MNARTSITTAFALAIALLSGHAFAHGEQVSGTSATLWNATGPVVYTNAAYTHAIPGAPNVAAETVSAHARVVYVDQAFGPAIYSYEGHHAHRPMIATTR